MWRGGNGGKRVGDKGILCFMFVYHSYVTFCYPCYFGPWRCPTFFKTSLNWNG